MSAPDLDPDKRFLLAMVAILGVSIMLVGMALGGIRDRLDAIEKALAAKEAGK